MMTGANDESRFFQRVKGNPTTSWIGPMIVFSRESKLKSAALVDGLGVRAPARIAGVDRETVATLALRVERGCAELHDRMMVRLRVSRCELDELWSFVQRKRRGRALTSP